MKKALLYGTGVIVFLLLVVYITLQFFLGSIVKAGVEKFGPGITQTKVELTSATLSPLSGQGTLTGLSVANPAGWPAGNAFYLGRIHIAMKPFSVFGDHIIIDEITIDQPQFTYDTKIVSSNINDLLKNIEQSMGAQKGGIQPKAKNGRPLKLEVKKFVLTNGKVTVGLAGNAITMPMPTVNMTDIGTAEGGVTPAGLAYAVMRNVTASVVAASANALQKMGGTSGATGAQEATQALDALKGLFSSPKKTK